MDWPTASVAAIVGGGVVAVIREIFSKKSNATQEKSLDHVLLSAFQQDGHERRELLGKLVQAQNDTAFALKEMALLNRHQDTKSEEFHRQTHNKLDDITTNQKDIKATIEASVDKILSIRKAA
jgi:hypothetical protein